VIIGTRDTDKQVLIIAELGNNHEGSMDTAVRLVKEAATAGVDAVKFQTYKTERFISRTDSARYKRLHSFQLSFNEFRELSDIAHSLGLLFISTPLDLESALFLNDIVDAFKIASGDITFYPLLSMVAQTGKPIILSTGASEPEQVDKAVSLIEKSWDDNNRSSDLALLHCVSCYPVPPDQVNLGCIRTLSERYPYTTGYSDHTIGIEASVLAVGCGARIIEKHFTLDKSFSQFRDHQLSSDPNDLAELVRRVRFASSLIGKMPKRIQPCESAIIPAVRRSIAARIDMKKGHLIGMSDLMWIRPGGGLAPGDEFELIGKKLKKEISAGDQINIKDIE
jgi:sialic acid synthase SpsE